MAVTFDDGYQDNYTNAYPVLKRYNIPATFFLTTDHIGTRKIFWWNKISEIIKKTKEPSVDLQRLQKFSNGNFSFLRQIDLGQQKTGTGLYYIS